MDRLRRTLSFRSRKKKRKHQTESTKPPQWQEDEKKVKEGTCSFQVKYLGCAEVFESRGMQVCEEAHKLLRNNAKKSHRLSFRRKKKKSQKAVQAILYISGDSLRVVEDRAGIVTDDGQGLIVDQTIEKVSFCAPDREHEKGFSYICRDGTTKRWMCHGFLALKESGERLSHAVGCAFAVCLEKKQLREKESVSVSFNDDKTSFSRLGSFRQATLTERLADPQSTKVVDPTAAPSASAQVEVTAKVERPQASQDLLMRQGSFREFTKLNSQTSPFKRNRSLRPNELPSNLARQQNFTSGGVNSGGVPHVSTVPILEQDEDAAQATGPLDRLDANLSDIHAATQNTEADPIAALCRQMSQGMQGVQQPPSAGVQNGVKSPQPAVNSSASGAPVAQEPTNPWAAPQFWLPSTTAPATMTPGSSAATVTITASNTSSTTTTNGISTARPRPTVQSPPVTQSALFLQNNFSNPANEQPKNNNVTNGITVTPLSANQTNPTNPFDTSWAVKTSSPNNPFLATSPNANSPTTNTHQQYSKEFELKM